MLIIDVGRRSGMVMLWWITLARGDIWERYINGTVALCQPTWMIFLSVNRD